MPGFGRQNLCCASLRWGGGGSEPSPYRSYLLPLAILALGPLRMILSILSLPVIVGFALSYPVPMKGGFALSG